MDNHIRKILYKSNYVFNNPLNEVFSLNEDDDEVISLDDLDTEKGEEIEQGGDISNNNQEQTSTETIETDKDVLKKHNEILNNTLVNLKNINSIIDNIENFISNMDNKYDVITKELQNKYNALGDVVEEMREPTNYEKLNKMTDYSEPYDINMNKVWNDKKYSGSNNIVRMNDGTYVGVFDNIDSIANTNNIESTFYEYE